MVEWWRIRERKLAVRWGSRGAFRVEKRRVEFDAIIGKRGSTSDYDDDDNEPFPWWKREIRILTSLPVIALAALALTGILTGLFIIEAFVTHLYTGPGHQVASLFPTILFAALVPQFMALYQKIAARLSEYSSRYCAHHALIPLCSQLGEPRSPIYSRFKSDNQNICPLGNHCIPWPRPQCFRICTVRGGHHGHRPHDLFRRRDRIAVID